MRSDTIDYCYFTGTGNTWPGETYAPWRAVKIRDMLPERRRR